MSEWKKVKLGDICDSQYGYTASTIEDNTGTKFLRITDIVPNQIDWDAVPFCNISNKERDKYILHKGDIVVARTGATVGYAKYIKQDVQSVFASYLVRFVVKREDVFSQYVGYCVESSLFKDYINSIANGSAQPNANSQMMSSFEFKIPSLPTQHRIATILSRYDSLIENYQKQIKLLEEAAQRLYKEWFVDLHFPGHENTKIVDGVPEGWEKKKVGEIAEINKRNIPKNYEYTFVNYTDLGNVRLGKMDTPIRYNYGEEPGRAKRVAVDGDIIWGMVRPNLKSYALVQYPKEQDVFSTGFAVLTAKRVPFSFLYCYVTTEAFVGYLVNCTNGAAYPAVKPEHFSKAEIVIPSKCTMDVFNRLVEPMFRRVGKFQSQIRLLTEARDRLLPKMMGGEIAV